MAVMTIAVALEEVEEELLEKPVSLTYRCPCRYFESNVSKSNIKHLKILSTTNCSLQIVARLKHNGKQICLDPKIKWIQEYLEKALNNCLSPALCFPALAVSAGQPESRAVTSPLCFPAAVLTASAGKQSAGDRQLKAVGLLYDEPNSVDHAEKTLLALCQGQEAAESYCQKFRKWSVLTKWNEDALAAIFRKGLSESVKDVMVEDSANISPVGVNIWREDENIIQIDYDRGGEHIPEDIVDKVLENGWGITEPEGHHQILIVPLPGMKSHLPFVPLTDANQVGHWSELQKNGKVFKVKIGWVMKGLNDSLEENATMSSEPPPMVTRHDSFLTTMDIY
ncbi:unnamed protein product [Ranitomeya imitator]|uniref:Chemokine interleukin-8-like domain-containing protein n=1 Tax=Ranitomeya imitator TaxID=111125 RepID=A0ABN9MHN5_9NEOB|nr:unnamed protein product [Ranitomeya imitator]